MDYLGLRGVHGYPQKQICLLLPEQLSIGLREIRSQYGSLIDFYQESSFVQSTLFQDKVQIRGVRITAIPLNRGSQSSFIYTFEQTLDLVTRLQAKRVLLVHLEQSFDTFWLFVTSKL